MTSRLAAAKLAYFSIDRRVLGAFRILYGCVLLYDLIRRVVNLRLLYTNDGLLANHFLLYAPQVDFQFSIYKAFSSFGEVCVAFALTGLVYLAYTVGLFTRWAQILSLLCLTSINQRNLFFEDGGMSTMIVVAVWTLFLPLGDALSVDALRRDARLPTIAERVRARKIVEVPAVSLAVLAIVLQILTIYFLNVVHKTGDTWRDGTAVHYVLWQNRVNTMIGNWLAYHEPSFFSPIATRMTIVVESLIPVLVLWPKGRVWTRSLAFLLAIGLHGGIALVMTLGPFSYAMIALVSLMLPFEALELSKRLLFGRILWQVARLRARAVRALARFSGTRSTQVLSPALEFRDTWLRRFRESLVALVVIISAFEVTANNRAFQSVVRVTMPPPFVTFVAYLRMIQSWNMFAPDAPIDDGMMIIDAQMANGAHVNPFTGEPPDFESGVRHPVLETGMECDYLFAMRVGNEQYRDQLRQFLMRWHVYHRRPSSERIVRYDVYWINHRSPPIGSLEPFDFKKELMWSGP